jgi:hypothetical protein
MAGTFGCDFCTAAVMRKPVFHRAGSACTAGNPPAARRPRWRGIRHSRAAASAPGSRAGNRPRSCAPHTRKPRAPPGHAGKQRPTAHRRSRKRAWGRRSFAHVTSNKTYESPRGSGPVRRFAAARTTVLALRIEIGMPPGTCTAEVHATVVPCCNAGVCPRTACLIIQGGNRERGYRELYRRVSGRPSRSRNSSPRRSGCGAQSS